MRSGGWLAWSALREAIGRLHRGWEALPPPARGRWWRALGAGIAAVLALTAALVWTARALEAAGALAWERAALRWITQELPISFSFGMWLEGPGNGFVLWALMLCAAAVAAWRRRPLHALGFLVGYSLVYAYIAFGWWLWDRERPQLVRDGIADPGGVFHAFPSGHMVQSAFAYGLLFWLWARAARGPGERLLAAASYAALLAMIALGRLRIGSHWPTDIIAGTCIGVAWAAAVATAVARAEDAA